MAIFEAIQTVKQLFMSLLMEADGPDSTQKGETAIRAIDWITLVGRHLNQTRAELQVGAVEHFARVAKFQAEVVSTVHMLCMLKCLHITEKLLTTIGRGH